LNMDGLVGIVGGGTPSQVDIRLKYFGGGGNGDTNPESDDCWSMY